MLEASKGGFTNATDLADYLVKKGLAFRDAHKITGEIVFDCIKNNISLDEFPLEKYKSYSQLIEEDIYDEIDVRHCVQYRNSIGGPSVNQVQISIENIREKYLK